MTKWFTVNGLEIAVDVHKWEGDEERESYCSAWVKINNQNLANVDFNNIGFTSLITSNFPSDLTNIPFYIGLDLDSCEGLSQAVLSDDIDYLEVENMDLSGAKFNVNCEISIKNYCSNLDKIAELGAKIKQLNIYPNKSYANDVSLKGVDFSKMIGCINVDAVCNDLTEAIWGDNISELHLTNSNVTGMNFSNIGYVNLHHCRGIAEAKYGHPDKENTVNIMWSHLNGVNLSNVDNVELYKCAYLRDATLNDNTNSIKIEYCNLNGFVFPENIQKVELLECINLQKSCSTINRNIDELVLADCDVTDIDFSDFMINPTFITYQQDLEDGGDYDDYDDNPADWYEDELDEDELDY